MGAAEKLHMTLEDYFALDANSHGERYEYLGGEVFPVEAASIEHNMILANVQGNLFSYFKSKPCKVLSQAQKVQAETGSSYCLPDLVVVCNDIETMPGHSDVIINPNLVIEILSPTTQDYDLGGKYKLYRNIASLTEYVCISSSEKYVLKHNRKGQNFWTMTELDKLTDTLVLESIGLQLPLEELYTGIVF